MRENGTPADGDMPPPEKPDGRPEETGFVLDDELRSAATPFLYLLASLMAALAAYFLYTLFRG